MLHLSNARLKAKFDNIQQQNFECRCCKVFRIKDMKCKLKFIDENNIKNAKACSKGDYCRMKER